VCPYTGFVVDAEVVGESLAVEYAVVVAVAVAVVAVEECEEGEEVLTEEKSPTDHIGLHKGHEEDPHLQPEKVDHSQ
jgi:hypothetical protein